MVNLMTTEIDEETGEVRKFDDAGNMVYYEYAEYWVKNTFDENNNLILTEDEDGYWRKFEYDSRGNEIYWESSDGSWERVAYDEDGYAIMQEDADGRWMKRGTY